MGMQDASPVWDDLPLEDDPVELQGIECWQRFISAATVWLGIDPNDTLQHRSAREHDDERPVKPSSAPGDRARPEPLDAPR